MARYAMSFDVDPGMLDHPALDELVRSKFQRHCDREGVTIVGPIDWHTVQPITMDNGEPMVLTLDDGTPVPPRWGVLVSAPAEPAR